MMRICYVLLSPTFGMHQYTADLANRMAEAGHEVTVVTTKLRPEGRYAPSVQLVTPLRMASTGFSREGLRWGDQKAVMASVTGSRPDVVHFTGPHLWNVNLVRQLHAEGLPVLHTIHDLTPHSGMQMGFLLGLWNRLIIRQADHILVHGEMYRQSLIGRGVPASKVTSTPLLHLFVGYELERRLRDGEVGQPIEYEPFALFFGRLEKYKGIDHLLAAFAQLRQEGGVEAQLVIAGAGEMSTFWAGQLPQNAMLFKGLVDDEAAVDLFRRCSMVILPYTDATQSALVAAAYFFEKPVIVTRSGALGEYVVPGKTGYIVQAGHPPSLARLLKRSFGSPESLQVMGRAGRAWYEDRRSRELASLLRLYSSFGKGTHET